MKQTKIVFRLFLIANVQFAKPIEPREKHLDHPAAGSLAFLLFLLLFAAGSDVRNISMVDDLLPGFLADIPGIGAQMGVKLFLRLLRLKDQVIQCFSQQLNVVPVRSVDRQRDRQPTLIDEYAALCPIFFPDLSGFYRQLRGRAAL